MKQIYDNKDIGETIDKSFDAGIKEGYHRCMEQMMEKAVEAEVLDLGMNYLDLSLFDAEKIGVKEGDKVRIIIVKEDEK